MTNRLIPKSSAASIAFTAPSKSIKSVLSWPVFPPDPALKITASQPFITSLISCTVPSKLAKAVSIPLASSSFACSSLRTIARTVCTSLSFKMFTICLPT